MKKFVILLLLFLFASIISISLSIWKELESTDISKGRLRLYDRNGSILADLPRTGGYGIEYRGHFSYPLIESIILIEDRRFFSHFGIDIRGKIGALIENLSAGKTVRGGSTITEQYIKNRYFSTARRTLIQKARESFYALILELKSSKEEILEGYLDTVYMGNGIYGIAGAIGIYFSEADIGKLSKESLLEIITRVKYPELTRGSEDYTRRIAQKLGLSLETYTFPNREKHEYTDIFPFLTTRIKKEISKYCQGGGGTLDHFLMTIPEDLCTKSDLSLKTSIDMEGNLHAQRVLEGVLFPLEAKNVYNGSIYAWSEKEKKVIIYQGNRVNTRENAIDMITRKRSVGSVLKPFIYELALESGASPDTLILDDTRIYETEKRGTSYTPENYIPKSYGPITLKEALGNSLNSATVRLSEKIGIGKIYDRYRSIGLELDHHAGYYGYGISLGSVDLSLENIVAGYRSLRDLESPTKFLLFDILSNSANRARTFGVSSILGTSVPLAVKTGTSTDFRDNWVIGYHRDLILGVWVGNTDNSSMDDVSGVTGAGPIYHSIAEDLIARGYVGSQHNPPPPGVVLTFLCMDVKCLQKSASYIPEGWTRKSRPLSNLYYKEDFITPMTDEEIKKWKLR